jgi:hypothetical protein
MSENNNRSSPAHLLLLTADTHVFIVLRIFMVFTLSLLVTNTGPSIYNRKPTTILSTVQTNNRTQATGRSSDWILNFDKSCRERGYEIIDRLNFVKRSFFLSENHNITLLGLAQCISLDKEIRGSL